MTLEIQRLNDLIEFAKQSARLRSSPATSVSTHNQFVLHEFQIHSLPGIKLDQVDEADEVWLSIDRLRQTHPPVVASSVLRAWIEVTGSPSTKPALKAAISGESLIEAGTHRSSLKKILSAQEEQLPEVHPRQSILLANYEQEQEVRSQFDLYLNLEWERWADDEKRRRKTIQLYQQLFTLKQQLEGGIVEAQIELVMGVGICIWNTQGCSVSYPLITRSVELNLNPSSAAIEIRPRDIDQNLELDWYSATDNPGVKDLEKVARDLFAKSPDTFSPFDRSTFEEILRAAATNLDPSGVFWPDQALQGDRSLPKTEEHLRVTDTWVVFARPRTNSTYLNDLQKLNERVSELESHIDLPGAVAAVVTQPATESIERILPLFRGVSASYHDNGAPPRDLYFPKPFNDEQVRIVQLLETSQGVVVQGPPGTGKTHTIANIICHYLANGMRVLVTSMKESALAVLQEQLPLEIQPLAIPLLVSEQEGMRRFEHAIQRIASEVQALDRSAMAKEIRDSEESLEILHAHLARIDREIGDWAQKNLCQLNLDGETIEPFDAATEVCRQTDSFGWMPDRLKPEASCRPQFEDSDVIRLRELRKLLGMDIDYLGTALPQMSELPDSAKILQVHRDLASYSQLQNEIESGNIPPLEDSAAGTMPKVQTLLNDLLSIRALRAGLLSKKENWIVSVNELLRQTETASAFVALENLGRLVDGIADRRKTYLVRPVSAPSGAEQDPELLEAVQNLSNEKSPFGLIGLFGKSKQKARLAEILIIGRPPQSAGDWLHVQGFLVAQNQLREIAIRWDAVAAEFGWPKSGNGPEQGLDAIAKYEIYRKIRKLVTLERTVSQKAQALLPSWNAASSMLVRPEVPRCTRKDIAPPPCWLSSVFRLGDQRAISTSTRRSERSDRSRNQRVS